MELSVEKDVNYSVIIIIAHIHRERILKGGGQSLKLYVKDGIIIKLGKSRRFAVNYSTLDVCFLQNRT